MADRYTMRYFLIRISENGQYACIFDMETGKAEVKPAIVWQYLKDETESSR